VENKPSTKKQLSLKRSSDFLNIKLRGKRKSLSSWLLMSFKANDVGHLRFGCTISSKVGSAVIRNKLKRWTKEYFRKAIKDGFNPEFDINLVFRPMAKDFYTKLTFSDFCESMENVKKTS
jgi:ribonuclease P protein component